MTEVDQLFDNQPQHVRQAEQEMANPIQKGIGVGIESGMVLLVVAQNPMAISAYQHRCVITAKIGNVMKFDALPTIFATFCAARFVGSKLLQSPLFAGFFLQFFVSHRLFLSLNNSVDFGERRVARRGNLV